MPLVSRRHPSDVIMGGFFSSDCPKGTTKKGWWTAYCYPNNGYTLKINGKRVSKGDTGMNCNQQHAGDQCWAQWRSVQDVPAYCIDGHVYSPTWGFTGLADYACNDQIDTSCTNWGGCNQATASAAGTEIVRKTLSGEGQTIVGAGAALLLVGAAFIGKKRIAKKKRPDGEGHVQMQGDGVVGVV